MATCAIVAGLVAIVYYPGRLGPGAVFVALFAALIGGSPDRRIVPVAVAVAAVGWLVGMTVSVMLERPIF